MRLGGPWGFPAHHNKEMSDRAKNLGRAVAGSFEHVFCPLKMPLLTSCAIVS